VLNYLPMEIREKVYTLHRYVDENGVPDLGRIFSKEGESPLRRHLDPQLKKIWHNQPKEVQDVITGHLGRCGECKEEFEEKPEEKPDELPF